jgi:uncharacterized protein YndB with AHSA1/START domain
MAASNDETRAKPTFIITRLFKAPRAPRVWKAGAKVTSLTAGGGRRAAPLSFCETEFRPGGFFHYAMRFAGAPTMWGRSNYREIAAPERIVWLNG